MVIDILQVPLQVPKQLRPTVVPDSLQPDAGPAAESQGLEPALGTQVQAKVPEVECCWPPGPTAARRAVRPSGPLPRRSLTL